MEKSPRAVLDNNK